MHKLFYNLFVKLRRKSVLEKLIDAAFSGQDLNLYFEKNVVSETHLNILLFEAVMSENIPLVEFCLEKGADPYTCALDTKRPILEIACNKENQTLINLIRQFQQYYENIAALEGITVDYIL